MSVGKNVIVSGLSIALLCGVGIDMISLSAPADASAYHARVRAVGAQVKDRIGDWKGRPTELPRAAVKLLRPNVAFSTFYENSYTGRRATFLMVQVADARDLFGHYPPICYKMQGFQQVSGEPKDWTVDGLTIHGMEYQFEFRTFDRSESKCIMNFMIIPDGSTQRDITAVDAQAADLQKRFYGAGQVQVIVDSSYPAKEREEIFRALVGGNRELIDAIRAGVSQ
jgi:hypothetical protein